MSITVLGLCIFIGIAVAFGIALFLLNKKVNKIKVRTDGMKKLLWAASYYPDRVKAIKHNIDKSLKEIAEEYQGDSKVTK